jgi:hypothetical protein
MRLLSLSILLVFCLGGGCATRPKSVGETDRLKADLVGHSCGGREKTWKFQSQDQILHLTIDARQGNVYFLTLILHDSRVSGTYLARVRVEYSGEKIQSVGLLYIEKI